MCTKAIGYYLIGFGMLITGKYLFIMLLFEQKKQNFFNIPIRRL